MVSITYQIKCFISMFLDIPHSTHRYYGEILKAHENKIFVDTHSFYPYYVSCLTCHILENLIRDGHFDLKYKKFRYHILMVTKILLTKDKEEKSPLFNSKKSQGYYEHILGILRQQTEIIKLFTQVISIVDSVIKNDLYDGKAPYELTRLKNFSNQLESAAKNMNL